MKFSLRYKCFIFFIVCIVFSYTICQAVTMKNCIIGNLARENFIIANKDKLYFFTEISQTKLNQFGGRVRNNPYIFSKAWRNNFVDVFSREYFEYQRPYGENYLLLIIVSKDGNYVIKHISYPRRMAWNPWTHIFMYQGGVYCLNGPSYYYERTIFYLNLEKNCFEIVSLPNEIEKILAYAEMTESKTEIIE